VIEEEEGREDAGHRRVTVALPASTLQGVRSTSKDQAYTFSIIIIIIL
jgi:hypothetical protein